MDNIIKEFMEFVTINSSSKNERLIADKIKNIFDFLGIDYFEDNVGEKINGNTGNIIGKLKGKQGIKSILFSAHMDRVNNGENIKPKLIGGKITSSGNTILAADDVAGLVSIINGIKKVKEENIEHGDIEIVFTVCEEVGLLGSKYLDYSNLKSEMGFVFDSAGRLGRVINGAINQHAVKVQVYGKASHAGNAPKKGISAIKGASHFISMIKEGKINEITTSNFGIVHGGNATNIISDYTEVLGEIRSHDKKEIEKYKNYLCEKAKTVELNRKVKINIHSTESFQAFFIKKNEEICKILQDSFKKLKIIPKFEKGFGGMDANIFNSKGIKSVGIATGYSKNHSNKEEIITEDLIKSAILVKNIIQTATEYYKY